MQVIDGCVVSTAVETDVIIKQIQENNKLNLPNVATASFFRDRAPIAIVGGGPSLKDTLEELRAFKGPVMVCGSVHDFLVAHDIIGEYCVLCDPDPLIIHYLKRKQTKTKYLVASQCHPEIFKNLDLFNKWYYCNNTYIWHAGGDGFPLSNFGENQVVIGGGCTVGTRAIILAMCFGYSNIHLFGFDSCLDSNYKHHSYEFETKEETIGNITEIRLGGPESPIFRVAGYMLGQIFDFKKILELYKDKLEFTIHGDGALKYLMDLGKKQYIESLKGK